MRSSPGQRISVTQRQKATQVAWAGTFLLAGTIGLVIGMWLASGRISWQP